MDDNSVVDLKLHADFDDDTSFDVDVNGVDDDKLQSHVAIRHDDLLDRQLSEVEIDQEFYYFQML